MRQAECTWYEELEAATGRHAVSNVRSKRRVSKKTIRARRRKRIRWIALLLLLGVFVMVASRFVSLPQSMILRASGCPESLIELAERNPETFDFAKNYKKYVDKDWDIDISDEVETGQIPLFIQWDQRWGYQEYGNNFMALNGCGPTCLSMVYCGLTGDTEWHPLKMAQWSQEHGYYIPGAGTAWSLMSEGAESFGLSVREASPDVDTVMSELAEGKVIIGCMGPGDFTTQGHFIVLTKITDSGKIAVNDPNSKKRSSVAWDAERVVSQMKDMWIYDR